MSLHTAHESIRPINHAESVTLRRLGPLHVIHGPLIHGMAHERRLFWECRSCRAIWEVFDISDPPTICPNEEAVRDCEAAHFRERQTYWRAMGRIEDRMRSACQALGMPERRIRMVEP